MSGDVQDVEVSAKTGKGLDDLIEKILLQAELLELKANPSRDAEATVIEAQLDKGRGPVATVLVTRGTLKRGDVFVVGTESGRVRALVDDKGQQVKEARPVGPGRSARPRRRADGRRPADRGRERGAGARSRRLSPGTGDREAHRAGPDQLRHDVHQPAEATWSNSRWW